MHLFLHINLMRCYILFSLNVETWRVIYNVSSGFTLNFSFHCAVVFCVQIKHFYRWKSIRHRITIILILCHIFWLVFFCLPNFLFFRLIREALKWVVNLVIEFESGTYFVTKTTTDFSVGDDSVTINCDCNISERPFHH